MKNRSLTMTLLLSSLSMFGFGFALVPLYDVFCEVTGLNGKTAQQAAVITSKVSDKERWVTIEFMSHVQSNMPWKFKPETKRIKVHPGEITKVHFVADNLVDRSTLGQAIPSISPGIAAPYFHKTECFCFNQQHLSPLAHVEMPLIFYIDPAIPEDIHTLTLSYTLYNLSEQLLSYHRGNGI